MNVIVPFGDMFNHDIKNFNCHWQFDNQIQGFAIVAKRDITQGEEILIMYNDEMSHFEQFYNYGFINTDKRSQQLELTV